MTMTYSELRNALRESDECFFCTLERTLRQKHAEHYLYERIMDPHSRDVIVVRRGFCNHYFFTLLWEAGKQEVRTVLEFIRE